MPITFYPPTCPAAAGVNHAPAAAGNAAASAEATKMLRDALSGAAPVDRILLKAAAGAGKSYELMKLIGDAVKHPRCTRVAVIAFTNKQVHPLATALGAALGQDRVGLLVSRERLVDVPAEAHARATVVNSVTDLPGTCTVLIATCHRLGAIGELRRQQAHFGTGCNGTRPFDVLFVDEAWQLAHYLFDKVAKAAPITVGVGDVGQLPPLEIGANPWRGDPGYNPYRAWPTAYDGDARTWATELPAVWRPAAGQLALWRAFYPEWATLNCVAAPGDRVLEAGHLSRVAAKVWKQVGTGVPTILEVAGLPDPEAADIDLPLMQMAESLVDELLTAGLVLRQAVYDGTGAPTGGQLAATPRADHPDPLIAILATRNQAVDDAADVVARLRDKHGLNDNDVVSSTVDAYQGQTNGITVALHPLSGSAQLDEFNSAFGRLAVTCTRATHGLLVLSRPGLDQLLGEAPARPGTPFGEPGNRQLPRQTHQRILSTFARGTLRVPTTP